MNTPKQPTPQSETESNQAKAANTASETAIARLLDDAKTMRKQKTVDPKFKSLLEAGVTYMNAENYDEAAQKALAAMEIDDRSAIAWNLLAICMERLGHTARAISCYEKVLELDPEISETYHNLGLLAWKLELFEAAIQFLQIYSVREPESIDGPNNIASVLRDMGQYADAVEVLRSTIYANPEHPVLWNSLGTVLNDCGRLDEAVTFYDEAVRLQPGFARAHFNRGNALLFLGPLEDALADFEAALENPDNDYDKMHMTYARAQCLLAMGNLKEGWPAYESRLDPRYPGAAKFMIPVDQWTPGDELEGKNFVLVAEQGLGDEVMFMSVLDDLKKAIGPKGKLSVACERRLVPLMKASFKGIEFGPHLTIKDNGQPARLVPWVSAKPDEFDCWAPMASVMSAVRSNAKDFKKKAFIKPDKKRTAHWQDELSNYGDGPLIGLTWKSLKADPKRARFYAPFEDWGPIFDTKARFVCLQYGDVSAEIEHAREHFGVDIIMPEDIDLKNDLDELAALSANLDMVIGPMNASTQIAMATGTEGWIMDGSGIAWPFLGTGGRVPWYKNGHMFAPQQQGEWAPLINDMAAKLAERFTEDQQKKSA